MKSTRSAAGGRADAGRRLGTRWVQALAVLTLLGSLVPSPAAIAQESAPILELTTTIDGEPPNGYLKDPQISDDGHIVVFSSTASNLVPGDTNDEMDVFLADLRTGDLRRISEAWDGSEPNGQSRLSFGSYAAGGVALDDAGTLVTFESEASNLVPDDDNGDSDVFVHDIVRGTTELVSVSDTGEQWDAAWGPTISGDGRHIAFQAYNPTSTPVPGNVFIRDLQARTTTMAVPQYGCGYCFYMRLSRDGSVLAYTPYGSGDVIVLDLHSGAKVVVTDLPGAPDPYSSRSPFNGLELSDDGQVVAFGLKRWLVPGEFGATWETNSPAGLRYAAQAYVADLSVGRVELAAPGRDIMPERLCSLLFIDTYRCDEPVDTVGLQPGFEPSSNISVTSLSADGRHVGLSDGRRFDRNLQEMTWIGRGEVGYTRLSEDGTTILWKEGYHLYAQPTTTGTDLRITAATLGEEQVWVAGDLTVQSGTTSRVEDGPDAPEHAHRGGDIEAVDLIHRQRTDDVVVQLRLTSLPWLGPPSDEQSLADLAVDVAATRYELEGTIDGVRFILRASAGALSGLPRECPSTRPEPCERAGRRDPVGYRYELLICDPSCEPAGGMDGRYGVATDTVKLIVPADLLSAHPGAVITDVQARTTAAPDGALLDQVNLPDIHPLPARLEVGVAQADVDVADVPFVEFPIGGIDTFEHVLPRPPEQPLRAWVRLCTVDGCLVDVADVT